LGLYLFLLSVKEQRKSTFRYVTISLVFTSLVSTVPFIYVNSTENKSVDRFEHLLDMDKRRSATGRETLAIHYNMQGKPEKEIKQWRKAIAFTKNARYINNLASVYYKMQRYDLALRYLNRSLEVDSGYHYTHFSRGEVLIHLGRYEEAIAEFKRAIELKPDRIEYYRNLGANLANLGRNREAIEVLKEGLQKDPNYLPLYRDLGYTYYNLGVYAQAERYLKFYLDKQPQAEDQDQVRQILYKTRQGLRHNR
jgi:tetratricopeptide (TPR) repeat protein